MSGIMLSWGLICTFDCAKKRIATGEGPCEKINAFLAENTFVLRASEFLSTVNLFLLNT